MNDRRTTRVLVVEDSPTQAKKLEIVLRSLGFEYEVARDGTRAWGGSRRRTSTSS